MPNQSYKPEQIVNLLRKIEVIIVILAATLFSTFSHIIACTVKTRERFMGVARYLPCHCSLPATRVTPPPSCLAG